MSVKNWNALACTFALTFALTANVRAVVVPDSAQTNADQSKAAATSLITAEELKAKLARNEPVTIIDVRSAEAFASSDSKIKGAVRVKLRRLQTRLGFPPLKDVPHGSEVVTYCAGANDESAVVAAQVLLGAGFTRVRVLKGGWQAWLKAKGQLEARPKAL